MATRTFHVTYERDRDGWWVASVPELPGCNTQGRTLVEAQANIRDALAGWTNDKRLAATAILIPDVRLPEQLSSLVKRTSKAMAALGLGPNDAITLLQAYR